MLKLIVMKKIILFLSVSISFCCFSQTEKLNSSISRLTEIMIEKNYSVSDREILSKNPVKLNILNYMYSKSFEISDHKTYTSDQFEKIDVTKYDLTRKLDEYVLVFDEASGLPLVLYSINKMESDKKLLMPSNMANQNPSNKISN